uniref:ABC transporter ATP-binding protein n=1 Tax=uncultured Altererythrobacter sp. TaxID=500840 RepID=UPI00260CADBF|nr:ABC transporter ATP-binding protein [uncultured Altererythrobacter sp.]
MNATEAQISLKDVACEIAGKRILDGIDLDLPRGAITVVLGPSGAGKSTLLRAIAGFEPVSAGMITCPTGILSSPKVTLPPEKRRIGVVVQSNALFPHMTAAENVRFGMDRSDGPGSAQEWLAKVELADRANAYPHELSGGEQQRIALARALARQPDVVLLDEAFSSLDQQLRKSMRRDAKLLLKEADAAVLVVTHDPDEALELADKIVVLSEGRIVQRGAPEDLYWRPQSIVAARLLGEVNALTGTWQDGVLRTAIGDVELPEIAENEPQTALFRPSALSLVPLPNGPWTVIETEFSGGNQFVTVKGKNGETLRVSGHTNVTTRVGDTVDVAFDPKRVGWA